MDFTLNDEQQMFAETARQLFADTCTPDHWRRQMESGAVLDEERWAQIVDTGFPLVLLPEEAGGLGLGELDFALIAEAAGYNALPDPLVESAGIATPLLAAARPEIELIADPAAIVGIQHPANPYVADAEAASALILHKEGEAYLAAREDVTLKRKESIDPFRRLYTVEWDPAKAQPLGAVDWELALDRGALFAAAQGLGLAQRAVDLAVEYAKERQQFGKPIGTYQAVKHHLSSAQVAIEFARPVVLAAAADLAHGDVQSRARISHAKLVALEAADQAARASIQVHGAMGYSWEVDVHLFLKRTLALTSSWGTPYFHRQRIMHRIAAQPLGPDQTFARETVHA
ncbi:acyl-CoA dehydrogenase family protein [Novosphingobium sp. PP1Y]|uniref:acyl-CoA dehydrogenase family protein n=1 Tax=Novosphingobium sp. PP1Y TaxID=702113 RepID=UPI00020EF941|nr:acyl-CoA dehydrogenase family protein [Novosphingobium sp. PP1Y]CCA90246.1 acyl-CoA dehydrogenase domain-containing protein [Novosphingobium sp. PP1Y]